MCLPTDELQLRFCKSQATIVRIGIVACGVILSTYRVLETETTVR